MYLVFLLGELLQECRLLRQALIHRLFLALELQYLLLQRFFGLLMGSELGLVAQNL